MTWEAAIRRARGANPYLQDAVLAVVVFAVQTADAVVAGRQHGEPTLTAAGVALIAAQAVPLVWRRRWPLPASAVAGLGAAAFGIAEQPDPVPLGALVGLYTVAAHTSRRARLAVLAVAVPSIALVIALSGDSDLADWYRALLFVGLTWVLGLQQAARASRAEADRAAEAGRAVAEERARIARELHDVVAHHVSMMVVQSEAGAAVAAQPERVEAAFDAVAATGRQALTELRRLLGVLRDDRSPGAAVAPQPGIETLDELVGQVRDAGLRVDLHVDGEPRALPAGVGLSAYRIVQEALTNTMRHAGPAAAHVLVRYRPDALELEITDDGRGAAPVAGNGGHGLVGIRERVNLFGGDLVTGPRPGGGFGVSVRLPTGG